MEPQEIGPLTRRIVDMGEGEPPALIREWGKRLEAKNNAILLWAGATPQLKWWVMDVCVGRELAGDPVCAASPAKVERLVGPLAHEGRIAIMQALYYEPLSSSELSAATGFQGGGLYHHLRELKYAAYISDKEGKYALTQLGRELLVTICLIAEQAIVDRGEEGLAVGKPGAHHERRLRKRKGLVEQQGGTRGDGPP